MAENTTGTATSRARSVRPAVRKPTKLRLALSGASGSGKTWTALSIARVLTPRGRVVFIDSEPSDDENTAAELYADVFNFHMIDWTAGPYDPRDLALTIRDLGASPDRPEVVIVDSGSPFWRGPGGTLDIADGRFGGWKQATPAQDDLVQAILSAPFHVIFCMRAKQAYEVEEGNDKKQSVKKLGLAPIQRDDLEYEFQVVAMMDVDHRIDIGKTRCADLAGKSFHANQQDDFAVIVKGWLERGVAVLRMADVEMVTDAFDAIGAQADRTAAKRAFAEEFGRPAELDLDRLGAAWDWLVERTGVPVHPYRDDGRAGFHCVDCDLPAAAGWHDDNAPPWTPDDEAGGDDPQAAVKPDATTGTDDTTAAGAADEKAPESVVPVEPGAGPEVRKGRRRTGDDDGDDGGSPVREPSNPPPDGPAGGAEATVEDLTTARFAGESVLVGAGASTE